MTAAIQHRTSGPAHHGQSRFFASPSRVQRHGPRCRHARPANRVARPKTASRIFFAPGPKTHLANASQTLGTHQATWCWGYDFASGCAVAPNSVNSANATGVAGAAGQGVSLADGSITFQKGKAYLVVYSGKEQGSTNAADIASYQKNAGIFGYKLVALDIDGRPAKVGWGDYVKGALGSSTFDGVFFNQHGGLSGAVNGTVAGLFQNDLAPALGGYLNSGGYVALMQCRGVFADGFVNSIQSSFGGAPVFSAGGYNSMNYNGAVAYLPVNPSTDDGYFYSNRYSPWVKH